MIRFYPAAAKTSTGRARPSSSRSSASAAPSGPRAPYTPAMPRGASGRPNESSRASAGVDLAHRQGRPDRLRQRQRDRVVEGGELVEGARVGQR